MDWIKSQQEQEKRLRDLYQRAASAVVAPRKVLVRWQGPAQPVSGLVSKSMDGVYILDISPTLPADNQYSTFLHELGHILDGGQVPSNYHRLEPGSQAQAWLAEAAWRANPAIKARESRADRIAAVLAQAADNGAIDHIKYDEPVIFARLKALIFAGEQAAEAAEVEAWKVEQLRKAEVFRAHFAKKRGEA